MKVFPFQDVKAEKADEGSSNLTVRWLITKDTGAPNFAMRLFEMEPGGNSPFHSHDWEHEMFVIDGEGVAVSAEGEKPIRPGTVVFVQPNEKHQFRNTGKKTLRFLCLVPHHR